MAIADLVVSILTLLAIVWYVCETLKIRRASQEQAEALQKPCVVLVAAPRDPDDAILDGDGAVGEMVVDAHDGNVALVNIGSGPALNVYFEFRPIDPPNQANVAQRRGQFPAVASRETLVMQVPRGVLRNLEYEFVAICESLSGLCYESRIVIKNLVPTRSSFRRVTGKESTAATKPLAVPCGTRCFF